MKYIDFVKELTNSHLTSSEARLQAAIGMAEEAGEVLGVLKKNIFYGQHIDYTKLINELGDLHHYFTSMLIALGTTQEMVEKANIEKLKKRYPNGFSKEDAIKRVDTK